MVIKKCSHYAGMWEITPASRKEIPPAITLPHSITTTRKSVLSEIVGEICVFS